MFGIGFSEILVIFVLGLIVLGPEKLPRVAREAARWVGRARAVARQFQEQLQLEVDPPAPKSKPGAKAESLLPETGHTQVPTHPAAGDS